MSMTAAAETFPLPIARLPVNTKLLSCSAPSVCAPPPSPSRPRANPILSHTRNAPTETILTAKKKRAPAARVRACPAALTLKTSGEPDPFPHQECPHRNDLDRKKNAPPRRQVAPVPRHPVHEEDYMTAFLLHDRLEGVDQLGRQEA